jgi:hypothetical protein
MKINITKKEFRLLVDMLYLADWMMHSHAVGEEQHNHEYEKLRKKILSHYKEMQAEDIIEYSEKMDDFYETSDYDDYVYEKFIETYDNENFWDELISRLAVRDVVNEIGIEQFQSMDDTARVMKIEEVREHYSNEFQQHDLDNVTVKYDDLVKN